MANNVFLGEAEFQILGPLNPEMVRFHRLEIKPEMRKLMQSIKSGKFAEAGQTGDPLALFNNWLSGFHERYRKADRQIKLTDAQKAELIQNQQGRCAVSGAPIFVGDDVAVDHKDALATGGPDAVENMQITTPEANWRKGPRSS